MNAASKDVFISYSHLDRPLAARLASVLDGYGFTVWWDHALLGGDDFRRLIAEQIRDAAVVVALFSKNSIESGWVIDEAGRALQANKLVPVMIERVEMPLGFGRLHASRLLDWNDDPHAPGLLEVLRALERFCGRERANYQPPASDAGTQAPAGAGVTRHDRFSIHWWPDKGVRRVMTALLPLYLLALLVALGKAGFSRSGFLEWVRLLHVYSGMILLGGGIFLLLVFRLGDRAPTPQERAAIADVARPLFGGWRIAALAQLVTGFMLIVLRRSGIEGWIVQGTLFYAFALYLWWAGFHHALAAAQHDAMYQAQVSIEEYRRVRDRHLLIAVVMTAWVLITMIYRADADLSLWMGRLFGVGS